MASAPPKSSSSPPESSAAESSPPGAVDAVQARPGAGQVVVPLLLAVILGLASAVGVKSATSQPAPYDVPLPALPPPLYESDGVPVKETSVVKGRIAPELLHVLASQPDGAPPLRYQYVSMHADFTMSYVTGTETVFYDNAAFLKDGIESQANVRYDQAMKLAKVSLLPRKQGEDLTTLVSRICSELRRDGVEFLPNTEPVELPAYRFEHFEHKRQTDEGLLSNFTYVGPYGIYAIVIQITTLADLHEQCRPYADKIIRSFEPGWVAKKAMLLEDPDYGEYAGSGLLEKQVKLPGENEMRGGAS